MPRKTEEQFDIKLSTGNTYHLYGMGRSEQQFFLIAVDIYFEFVFAFPDHSSLSLHHL